MTLNQAIGRMIGGGTAGVRVRALFAIGAFVVLAAVAAVAVTQIDGGASVPARPASRTTIVAPPIHDDLPLTYYLVATQEQAQAVQQAEDEAARIRFEAGEPCPAYEIVVVVVEDEASLEWAWRGYHDAKWIRHESGLSEMTLVDLRGHGW